MNKIRFICAIVALVLACGVTVACNEAEATANQTTAETVSVVESTEA